MISRLPEDQGYWNALTDRLVISTYGRGATRWWHGLSRLSVPLGIAAAAALLAALVWQPEVSAPPGLYGFAPIDPLATPFVTSAVAPTMATLIAIPISEASQ
ncbi:MAG TPA: hypothetical protein VEK77_05850 [Gemmatimonadales bacterium]|nr:hypothetical protein [Gemmatimonadales bacterium]